MKKLPQLSGGELPLPAFNPSPLALKVLHACNRLLRHLDPDTRPHRFVVSPKTYGELENCFDENEVAAEQRSRFMAVFGIPVVADSTVLDDLVALRVHREDGTLYNFNQPERQGSGGLA